MQLCSAAQGASSRCPQAGASAGAGAGIQQHQPAGGQCFAVPCRAHPDSISAAATGRLEHGQACLPDLIWSFPGMDHFRPDRSSTAIQLHLTSQQSTGQPANQLVSPNQHPNRLMNRRWPAKFRHRGHENKRSLSGQPTTEGKRTSPAPATSTSTITHTCDKRDGCISLVPGRGCCCPDKRQTERPIHSPSSLHHPSQDSTKARLGPSLTASSNAVIATATHLRRRPVSFLTYLCCTRKPRIRMLSRGPEAFPLLPASGSATPDLPVRPGLP